MIRARRAAVLLPVVALLTAALPPTAAAPVRAKRDSAATPARRTYDILGTVERIDRAARTLVVQGSRNSGSKLYTVRYDSETEILKQRRPFNVGDIRPPMRVWVYFRDDADGRPTDVARRLTISDPYPDLYGQVKSVDANGGAIVILHRYPGSAADARLQPLKLRVTKDTEIRMGGQRIRLAEVPVGRRVAVTRVRDAQHKPTDAAGRITVWRETAKVKDGAPAGSKTGSPPPRETADDADAEEP
jgi:hypothetical protein